MMLGLEINGPPGKARTMLGKKRIGARKRPHMQQVLPTVSKMHEIRGKVQNMIQMIIQITVRVLPYSGPVIDKRLKLPRTDGQNLSSHIRTMMETSENDSKKQDIFVMKDNLALMYTWATILTSLHFTAV